MLVTGIVFLVAAGLLLIVKRREITDLHKAVIGARLHPGCAVAEGVVVIAFAAIMAVLYWRGWFE